MPLLQAAVSKGRAALCADASTTHISQLPQTAPVSALRHLTMNQQLGG